MRDIHIKINVLFIINKAIIINYLIFIIKYKTALRNLKYKIITFKSRKTLKPRKTLKS